MEKTAAEAVIIEETKYELKKLSFNWGCVDRKGEPHFFHTNEDAIEFSSKEQCKEFVEHANPLFSCFTLPLRSESDRIFSEE